MAVAPTSETIRADFAGGRAEDIPKNGLLEQKAIIVNTAPLIPDPASPTLAQHQLDDARRWLAAIADCSEDAIVGDDMGGVVMSWNKAAETMFGYKMAEIIGQPTTRIIPWDRIDEEAAVLDRVRRSQETVRFETKRQCKDGRIIPVFLIVSPVRDGQGKVTGVSKVARDLSEAQRAQNELERREALFRSILDTVPDALIVVDRQGIIHSFSVAAVRMFGWTSAEMVGRNISVLLPSTDWQRHNRELAGLSPTGARDISGFGQRRDRSTFPMSLAIGEVNLPKLRLFTVFVHDQTAPVERESALRAANAELEQLTQNLTTARDVADRANWAKSRFLADTSHDLRTPVNGILNYAQLLQLDGSLNKAQIERVVAIHGAGKHLLQMITSVDNLTEVEAEHVELEAVEIDVLAVGMACLNLVRPEADAKHLALSISVERDTQQAVVTDPMRMRQVLLNLLGNAVKFTSVGSVELRLRHVTECSVLRIEVADTGPGIPASDRRRLFRDFERLDKDAPGAVEGVGLGLGLSARLAALLGGCLGHHDNPDGGSVFWLELPLDNVATMPADLESAGVIAENPRMHPAALHVLVVDDVAMNRDIAGSFLRAAGHRVTCLESGAEAVAAAGSTDFDVILMDVRMPEMDGLEAARRIRALEGERGRVPIVALTAQAFTEQVAECRKAGMNSHISKPFEPETLLSAVARATAYGAAKDKELQAVSLPSPVAIPAIGSDLLVFNPAAFERTAHYLAPEAVTAYLDLIAEQGESLLHGLRKPDALLETGDKLADAAHAIAGSAGLLGFERLTVVGRRFERAVHAGAAEAPSLADGLSSALESTLQALQERTLTSVDADA